MRKIQGSIVLPPDAPEGTCRLLVEVRDVSRMDAPSVVVAQQQQQEVTLAPNAHVPFQVEVPEVEAGRALALRVHISMDGSEQVKRGDLLTTASYSIPTSGTPGPMTVPVKVI